MTASGKEETKAWMIGFGPKAEVLSPKLPEGRDQKGNLKKL